MTAGSNPARYGLPYQGSKNAIARWIVDNLPAADVLVDAFAGGCAITHAALLSGKWRRVIANDLSDAPQLFADAVAGRYANETRWIDRETFHALKDSDPYIRLCWSFGNNGDNYLYGEHLERYKKGYHYAAVFDDYSLWEAMGIHVPAAVQERGHALDPHERRLLLRRWVASNAAAIRAALRDDTPSTKSLQQRESLQSLERLQNLQRLDLLESLQRLERLQSLESLQSLQSLQRLESLQSLERLETLRRHTDRLTIVRGDYQALTLPAGETYTLYCDPPYADTDCGHYGGFDHARFYAWLQSLDHAAYISEYAMPDGFVQVAAREKKVSCTGQGNSITATERLFIQQRFATAATPTSLFPDL